ncbi:LacI family DNA-binding transcriptional regulator [Marinithermus hydrothermalis]|uniref:Transcriptional regulator, LacI family n=1 Tax=Marinithermus hydrothermalis (strain DSM 14884 / JCM 11576 / T1) TaxID=869210 RepID=F2NQU2_MARHT|nr:transcriptional regulator, LacI family [Marinithermus hydrothermalis DSM 14884]
MLDCIWKLTRSVSTGCHEEKITIHEVAKHAGVGIGTVSRVINNHPSVRPETRARVLAAMEALGYTPNPHARRIAGGRSYTVSVMLPFIATEFYTRLVEGIERVLSEQRYDLALFPILTKRRLERFLTSHTLAYQTDGLIVASYNLAELFPGGHLPTDRPVVFVDAQSPRHDSVYLDNRLGGRIAAEYLMRFPGGLYAIGVEEELDQAFKNTGFAERIQGFQETLAQHNRPLPPRHVFKTRFSAEGGRLALQHFLRQGSPPFNIFATADLVALGVIEEAQRLKLNIGQDVRVLGFDGQPWTEAKGISTLMQPVEAMGERAATLLLERMEGHKGRPRSVRFEPILIERTSTGYPPDAVYVP